MTGATLKELTRTFPANRIGAARAMRELRETDPRGFVQATTRILSDSLGVSGESPGARYLLTVLLAQADGLERICDPELFSLTESVALVQQSKAHDRQVEGSLARLAAHLSCETERQTNLGTRVLEVLSQVADAHTTLPALRHLLQSSDARLRSRAALLFGRISRDPRWVNIGDPREDERVVANALESLWGMDSPAILDIFREALRDPRNRVAGNGALGLYQAGDMQGAAALFRFSRGEEWLIRSTAAWCMGHTADARFLPRLAQMIKDPAPGVRAAAFRAVAMVSQRVKAWRKAGSVPLQIVAVEYHGGTHRLRVRAGEESAPALGLRAAEFVVWNGDAVVERFAFDPAEAPVYRIQYQAALPESGVVKVELYSESGCGVDTSSEMIVLEDLAEEAQQNQPY